MTEQHAEKIGNVLVAIYESKFAYFVLGFVIALAVS